MSSFVVLLPSLLLICSAREVHYCSAIPGELINSIPIFSAVILSCLALYHTLNGFIALVIYKVPHKPPFQVLYRLEDHIQVFTATLSIPGVDPEYLSYHRPGYPTTPRTKEDRPGLHCGLPDLPASGEHHPGARGDHYIRQDRRVLLRGGQPQTGVSTE